MTIAKPPLRTPSSPRPAVDPSERNGSGAAVAAACDRNFRCTGCGVCCTTPPMIHLPEIVGASRLFALGLVIAVTQALVPDRQANKALYETIYPHLKLMPPGERAMARQAIYDATVARGLRSGVEVTHLGDRQTGDRTWLVAHVKALSTKVESMPLPSCEVSGGMTACSTWGCGVRGVLRRALPE